MTIVANIAMIGFVHYLFRLIYHGITAKIRFLEVVVSVGFSPLEGFFYELSKTNYSCYSLCRMEEVDSV